MNLVLLLSAVLRFGAIAWSILLLWRLRDWRMGFLTAMLGLMMLRLLLTLVWQGKDWEQELPGLAVSLMALVLVVFLGPLLGEQRRATEARRVSEEKLEKAFRASPSAIVLLTIAEGRFLDANEGFARLTGYRRDEVLRHSSLEINLWPSPEDRARFIAALRRLGRIHDVELNFRIKSGETRTVSMSCEIIKIGDELCSITVARDITDRKLAEETLHQYAERLQSLSRQLMGAQEAERRHLARELHDEIGQSLTAVKINLQMALRLPADAARPRLEESIDFVQRTIEQARDLSLDLRPAMLDDLGLAAALRWYVERQVQRAGLAAHLDIEEDEPPLPADLKTTCFRITQEALTNVVRHAQARQVWVTLRRHGGELRLSVRDDGVGFDVADARRRAAEGGSTGLLGIQERVALLGGTMMLESTPAHGTVVRVQFPLNPSPPSAE